MGPLSEERCEFSGVSDIVVCCAGLLGMVSCKFCVNDWIYSGKLRTTSFMLSLSSLFCGDVMLLMDSRTLLYLYMRVGSLFI